MLKRRSMRSIARTLPSLEPWWVRFALTSLLLCVACAPQDAIGPRGGGATHRVADPPFDPAPVFYVSPSGSPSGDGSFANPWDLTTALGGPPAVTPGSTIWLRGGTYADGSFGGYWSDLRGTPEAPIVVRQYPGEHATLTKFLFVRGGYTWYWGFELAHTLPPAGNAFGIDVRAAGVKFINLVVHDATASGIFIWPEASSDVEVSGSIFFNNGRTNDLDHGIYCGSANSLVLQDNIVFDNWAFGIHCFDKPLPALRNVTLQGNVAFNNYIWGVPSGADIFVGGHFPASGIIIDHNYTYRSQNLNTRTADIGYNLAVNRDVVFTNNYFVGGWSRVGNWATATVSGNTLFNATHGWLLWNLGDLSGQRWSANRFFGDTTAAAWRYDSSSITNFRAWRALTKLDNPGGYAGAAPEGLQIVVRPNRYEPGRANIIVYNWAQHSTVSVDVAGILNVGDRYVVQNVQDFYGAPAAGGIYTGGLLDLPMGSVTPPTPLGTTPAQLAPVTGPTFNVFVLMKTGRGRCVPRDPPRCGFRDRMQ